MRTPRQFIEFLSIVLRSSGFVAFLSSAHWFLNESGSAKKNDITLSTFIGIEPGSFHLVNKPKQCLLYPWQTKCLFIILVKVFNTLSSDLYEIRTPGKNRFENQIFFENSTYTWTQKLPCASSRQFQSVLAQKNCYTTPRNTRTTTNLKEKQCPLLIRAPRRKTTRRANKPLKTTRQFEVSLYLQSQGNHGFFKNWMLRQT